MTTETNEAPGLSLTIMDVCDRLNRRLHWYGLPQLRTGMVMETNGDTIVAVLTDQHDMRKVSLAFDRRTGRVAPVCRPERPTPSTTRADDREPSLALAEL